MIVLDEDALICDFAETYHILNYRELPPTTAGVLACGLRDNSRIKLKMADVKVSLEDILLATIADKLENQMYQYAKAHGAKNIGELESILKRIQGEQKEESSLEAFESGEDFMKAWGN